MSKLKHDGNQSYFWCPGCDHSHTISIYSNILGGNWEFDGNEDSPTITPSVLITSGHYLSSHKPEDDCWCTFHRKYPGRCGFICRRCHSYITNGQIQFLPDSTHPLTGQTVPLPDYPIK